MNTCRQVRGILWWLSSKEFACSARGAGDAGPVPWVGKIPWRRKWQPTPVFLPGESHGQRSLEGYGPWGRKELNTTKATEHVHTGLPLVQWLVRQVEDLKGLLGKGRHIP